MQRETKQHLIYGTFFTVSLITLVFYYNYQITTLKLQMNEGLAFMQLSLKETQQSLEQSITEEQEARKAADTLANTGLSKLSDSLTERQMEIKTLTGDLSTLRIESQEQISSLQDNIKSVKIANQDFSAIIDDVVEGVVGIRTDKKQGSGFIVDKEGYIVTNYHVVQDATSAAVLTNDGANHRVRLVGRNEDADIAVLKIEGYFSYLEFTDSDSVEIGQKVIAVGSPGGLDFTVTQGIISAFRTVKGNKYIQIDVPINPGNSGGALVTIEGKVAGVNSLKLAGFEGLGFALASNQVTSIIYPIIQADKELLAELSQ